VKVELNKAVENKPAPIAYKGSVCGMYFRLNKPVDGKYFVFIDSEGKASLTVANGIDSQPAIYPGDVVTLTF